MKKLAKAILSTLLVFSFSIGTGAVSMAAIKNIDYTSIININEYADLIIDNNSNLIAYTPVCGEEPARYKQLDTNVQAIGDFIDGSILMLTKDGELYELIFKNGNPFNEFTKVKMSDNIRSFSVADGCVFTVNKYNEFHIIKRASNYQSIIPNVRYTYQNYAENVKKAVPIDKDGNGIYLTTDGRLMVKGIKYENDSKAVTPGQWMVLMRNIKDFYLNPMNDYYSIYVIDNENSLYTWGDNTYGQLGNGGKYSYISVRYSYSGVNDVNLYAWRIRKVMDNVRYLTFEDGGKKVYAETMPRGEIYSFGGSLPAQTSGSATEKYIDFVRKLDEDLSVPKYDAEKSTSDILSIVSDDSLNRSVTILSDGLMIGKGSYYTSFGDVDQDGKQILRNTDEDGEQYGYLKAKYQ